MTGLLTFLESLPPAPLYAVIAALAVIENAFPPVPADTAVALGALLAGRGVLRPWSVFWIAWVANVAGAALVYVAARRYGRGFFQGPLGRRLRSGQTLAHIARQYDRYGEWGIFVSRLLPVWRGVVTPFAGIAGLSAPRALIPIAVASALYYGTLTALIYALGANLDDVLRVLDRVNTILAVLAVVPLVILGAWIVRRLKR